LSVPFLCHEKVQAPRFLSLPRIQVFVEYPLQIWADRDGAWEPKAFDTDHNYALAEVHIVNQQLQGFADGRPGPIKEDQQCAKSKWGNTAPMLILVVVHGLQQGPDFGVRVNIRDERRRSGSSPRRHR